jgi:anti-sigma B factor antagonist
VNIKFEARTDQVYCIEPQGRLDAVTVPALESVLEQHLAANHVRLVLDMAGVAYLSSSGLRALLRARKGAQAAGGDVVLCNMTPRVREVFEMIGFTSLFRVFDGVAEASASFTAPKPAA